MYGTAMQNEVTNRKHRFELVASSTIRGCGAGLNKGDLYLLPPRTVLYNYELENKKTR